MDRVSEPSRALVDRSMVVVVVSGVAGADGNDDDDGGISSSLVVVAVNGGVDSSGGGTGIATAIGRSPSYSIGGALGDDDGGAGAGDGGGALGLNRKLYMTTLSRLVPLVYSFHSLFSDLH